LLDQVTPADSGAIGGLAAQDGGMAGRDHFGEAITDFYLTNPIARASAIMASLSAMHEAGADEATGTHG
jgi:NADH-quinone oxidoreductase subunit G